MGDIVDLAAVRRPSPPRRSPCSGGTAEIALFTGIRVERWCDAAPPRVEPPMPPRPPRRRRRRDG